MDPQITVATITIVLKGLAVAAYPLVEYWIGRTKKVKSNSVLELVLGSSLVIINSIRKSSEPPENSGESKK